MRNKKILEDTLGEKCKDTMKTFVPYKEVLELYNNGLKVPEEFTLIWANDNYGHIRRFPNEIERKRKGGHGIYYHNSYWAPPGGSYLFINSIPLAHTRNELYKAWQEGIRKLWVMNIGALKPLEQEIEFYLRFAWEVGKDNTITEDVDKYLEWWINTTFSGNHGEEMAQVLNEFAQLTNVRKIEQLDTDTFSHNAYGDEASVRMIHYQKLFDRANKVYEMLPQNEKDAFFQMCLMKIHAAYISNAMYYYADRSALCVKQGKNNAARTYVKYCREYDDVRRKMLEYYGKKMSEGKWEKIVTPEDFPPPRTAMFPACVPPLSMAVKKLIVDCWNNESEFRFVTKAIKWIQVANSGEGELSYKIEAPSWVTLSDCQGMVGAEKRIFVSISDDDTGIKEDVIKVYCKETSQCIEIPVFADLSNADILNIEDGGIIDIKADTAAEFFDSKYQGWKVIKRLGRGEGNLVEAVQKGAALTYSFFINSEISKDILLEIHRFPSLNAVGQIRVMYSIDDGEKYTLETEANDEWCGTWKQNIRDNVDKICVNIPFVKAGKHTLKIYAMDKYFAMSKLVIYTKDKKYNMLGKVDGDYDLPPVDAEW